MCERVLGCVALVVRPSKRRRRVVVCGAAYAHVSLSFDPSLPTHLMCAMNGIHSQGAVGGVVSRCICLCRVQSERERAHGFCLHRSACPRPSPLPRPIQKSTGKGIAQSRKPVLVISNLYNSKRYGIRRGAGNSDVISTDLTISGWLLSARIHLPAF